MQISKWSSNLHGQQNQQGLVCELEVDEIDNVSGQIMTLDT